jgi:broad specificity phosphatase PhoE
MNTTIHYVRHAGFANPDRIVPGRIPGYQLSEEGKRKAKSVGEFFKGKPIKYIYSSPLERAYETANIISESLQKAKIIHSYQLTEVDSAHWQAYKLEELFTNNYYEQFLNNPDSSEVPENLNKLAKRVKDFTFELCKKHSGEEIVCVSHFYPIIALQLSLQGKPLSMAKNYEVGSASIVTFEFDEKCQLIKVTSVNP